VSLTYSAPWPDPQSGPADSSTAPARTGGRIGTIVAAVAGGAVVAASGLLLGWLWAEVAPRIPVTRVENGFVYADAEPEQAIAADGWFAILGTLAGVAFAVLAWLLLRRYRGVAMLVGLALGSLVAASLALWLGHKIGFDQFTAARAHAAIGDRVNAPLDLRVTSLDADRWWIPKLTGVAAVQALVATFVYTCLAGFSSYSTLRGPDPAPPGSEVPWQYRTEPPAVPDPYPPQWPYQESAGAGQAQLGPGLTGSSDSATGTART
jgi:hypothetical protein